MALRVIGLGVGRTGTYSVKFALEELGFGPCHHMEEVDATSPEAASKWKELAEGTGDLAAAYAGYHSAVDWPTAAFVTELPAAFPQAKFLLTERDPDSWYASFSETIYPLIQPDSPAPAELLPFLDMVRTMVRKTGFAITATRLELVAAYNLHGAKVRATIPQDRLLVFDLRDGWEPLCRFLDVPVPQKEFPRSNSKAEFWESMETGEKPAVHWGAA